MCVDRCVCFDRSFVDLLSIARRTGAASLEALQEETEFGLACRICNPYVRRMLRTGQTTFDALLSHVDEPPPGPPAKTG
ncbi:MAG: (2Fe-2S)-binding protein [Deltaproteobacteria bacterium]|nr:(2Fe-2S)-binding protein [Deltaproteobacteria bacterium]